MLYEPGEREETKDIAKRLYEKNGFVVEGVKRNSLVIAGEYVDEYYMARLIDGEKR